jgi:hypothetical protein
VTLHLLQQIQLLAFDPLCGLLPWGNSGTGRFIRLLNLMAWVNIPSGHPFLAHPLLGDVKRCQHGCPGLPNNLQHIIDVRLKGGSL